MTRFIDGTHGPARRGPNPKGTSVNAAYFRQQLNTAAAGKAEAAADCRRADAAVAAAAQAPAAAQARAYRARNEARQDLAFWVRQEAFFADALRRLGADERQSA